MAVPLILYLLALRHLWFNAPVWDDYDAILDSPMALMDAASAMQWLSALVMQHNEHRVVVARLIAWSMAKLSGHIDFRFVMLIGNLSWLGILLLVWLEFRDRVVPALLGAAALLMLQWTYYEAALMSMAAISNIGVVFFSFACLYCATRDGARELALAAVFGVLAAATQANGLFALPLAAAGCIALRRPRRAAVLAAVAVALWVPYFIGYSRPSNHPSVFAALSDPLSAVQLFLVIIGAIAPGRWLPIPVGAAILAALVWLTRRGAWRAHPSAALWIVFILLSAVAATAGRVGFGVFNASRYAIYSSCLVALIVICASVVSRPWTRTAVITTVTLSAGVSAALSAWSWPHAVEYSFKGRLLSKAIPASYDVSADRYFGMLHPGQAWAERILNAAERHGIYAPKQVEVYETRVRPVAAITSALPVAGRIDMVQVSGKRVTASGWSHLPATVPGRSFSMKAQPTPNSVGVAATSREDVATALREPALLFSGFELVADYPAPEEAARAAASLCLVVEAPGHEGALLGRPGGSCEVPKPF